MKVTKLFKFAGAAALSIACLAGMAACSTSGSNGSTGGVAVTVNGTDISEDTITDYIQNYRTSQSLSDDDSWGNWMAQYQLTPSSVRQEVIDYFVENELVKEAAAENDVQVSDDDVNSQVDAMKANYSSDEAWTQALSEAGTSEDAYRDSVRQAMLQSGLKEKVASDSATASDEDVLTYVQQYSTYFNGAKKSEHILFNKDDQETAQSVLDQINAGSLSFEDAAKQYSTDTASAQDGGNVGWDMLNSFVTEYTDALSGLEKDKVSGLVTSEYGIHIIKCTDVFNAPEEITSLDQVPAEIVDYVRQMVQSSNESTAYSDWMKEYKDKADIKQNDMPEGVPYNLDMSKYQTADSSSEATSTEVTSDAVAESAEGESEAASESAAESASESTTESAATSESSSAAA